MLQSIARCQNSVTPRGPLQIVDVGTKDHHISLMAIANVKASRDLVYS